MISSLLHCLVSFYFSKCPPTAAMHFTALALMSIIALLTIAGSICATSLEIWQKNLLGSQAKSSWYPQLILVTHPRCPRRQCNVFQLRGIFSTHCVTLHSLCNLQKLFYFPILIYAVLSRGNFVANLLTLVHKRMKLVHCTMCSS